LKQNKIQKTIRLSPFNFDLVRDMADACFDGNFSESLNFLLDLIRLQSKWSEDLKMFQYRARYLRGERSTEVLDKIKKAEGIILRYILNTEL
jgi:hypothetical protein